MKKALSFLLTAIIMLSSVVCSAAENTNVLPTVQAAVDKTLYAYGETVTLSYEAADSDGELRSLTLYLNGEKHMDLPMSAAAAEQNLGALQPGYYRATVEATDNLGGIGKAAATFVVQKTEETLLSFDDFEEESTRSNNWKVVSQSVAVADYRIHTDAADALGLNGYSFYLQNNGESTSPNLQSVTALTEQMTSGDIEVEFDILATGRDEGDNKIFLHRSSTWYNDLIYGRIDYKPKLEYKGVAKLDLPIDSWYTLKYCFNLQEKTTSAYWKHKGEQAYTFLGSKDNVALPDTLDDFRIECPGYRGYARYIDNIKVVKKVTAPYASEPKFYTDGSAGEYDLDCVPSGVNKIVIPFSTAMDADTINAATVSVTKGGEPIAVTSVEYDQTAKAATVILTQSTLSNTQYTVAVSDAVKAASGLSLAAAQRYTFKTDYKDFDSTGVYAYVDDSLASMADIQAGDTVDFAYFVQNKTQEPQSGYLIFVVYEKGEMRFADIQSVTVEAGAEAKSIPAGRSYTASAAPDCIEVYFWTELVGGRNLLHPQTIQ